MPSPYQVVDSPAGTFTAQYSADGSLAAQTYPGGLTATYGYDETGAVTSLSYAGESWTSPLSDTVTPNAHGDWASRAVADTGVSLASSQALSYDSADRLASVQDTEAGQCTTRT
jgi:YD repeat-containing protein